MTKTGIAKLLNHLMIIYPEPIKLEGFAEVCYDQTSADELYEGVTTPQQPNLEWGISGRGVVRIMRVALAEQYRDFLEEYDCVPIGQVSRKKCERLMAEHEGRLPKFLGLEHIPKKLI